MIILLYAVVISLGRHRGWCCEPQRGSGFPGERLPARQPEGREKEQDLYSLRVMWASEPPVNSPLPFIGEESQSRADMGDGTERARRKADNPTFLGNLAICNSINSWVLDKKTALDQYGETVTVLDMAPSPSGPTKQIFFEVTCPNTPTSRCGGTDEKNRTFECKPRQSLVKAMTMDSKKKRGGG
eukprot:gi/632987703/ref/XP_007882702.1/ PREDICTED: brain-derived neurotrophic factor-like [Callorhinchus milii]